MLFSDSSGATVSLVKLYDFKVEGRFIDSQTNLEIYKLNESNHLKKLLPFMVSERRALISSHYIYSDKWFSVIKATPLWSKRFIIEASLIHTHEDFDKIILYHPEHGKKEINLEPDVYYMLLHITDRRQAEK